MLPQAVPRCGLSLIGLSPRHYGDVAAAAEAAGFDSIWVPEHVVFPSRIPAQYPYTPDGDAGYPASTPLFDPWVSLSYIACATSTVRLGTHVCILPLRHPFLTARALVTLDRLSGGRVILGAGVGWLETEFEALGEDFHSRGRRADEIIPLLRRLWTEDEIEHHGEHFSFEPVHFDPKPVQKPAIPIHVGGSSRAALRRAASLGDGYIDIGATSVDDVRARLEVIDKHRLDAGRSDLPFEVTVSAELFDDRSQHERLAEIGVARILAHPWMGHDRAGSRDDALAFIESFAASRTELGFA